jgi:arginyl-tRNA synthetase
MKPIVDILEQRISLVMTDIAGEPVPAIVKPTRGPKPSGYQANGVMRLAKKLKQNPRQLAQKIVDNLDLADICETPEIAGPGFINLRLRTDWLAERLAEAIKDKDRLGVDPLDEAPITVVDFSSPNIAKQMHVGHLRSTIIGDVIARVLEFWYGDENTSDDNPEKKVLRQNHVGDWGLQMGMVVEAMTRHAWNEIQRQGDLETLALIEARDPSWVDRCIDILNFDLDQLEDLYKKTNLVLETGHPSLEKNVRGALVGLQGGESDCVRLWNKAREVSLRACFDIYKKLNVKLTQDNIRGESFYNDKLPSVISDLSVANLIKESDGAMCVFLDGFKNKEGEPLPLIVQKSDGAYLYATTDLAAVRFRVDELKADRVIYVTDARQKLHFEMVFACARRAGWAAEDVKLEHVPFGSVMGDDGRPFKTRSGENIKLKDLLDEAETRARKIVDEKNPDLDESLREEIARAVGVGAVKYADLSNNLVSDYVFNWDKMLAMEGNTAPYMQYAYARVRSIFRKGGVNEDELLNQNHPLVLTEPDELALAKLLLRFGEVIETVARDLRPHLLTNYLFDLAQAFSGFYTNCPVLKAEPSARTSRLLLCYQTARTIRCGLGLLGIETIEQM